MEEKISSTAVSCIQRLCLGLRIYSPSQTDKIHSNMDPVCLSKSSDIRVNLDGVCVAGVAAIFHPKRDDTFDH